MSTEVIIIRESTVGSIVSDLWTFGCLLGSIGIGVAIGSDALQWIAGFMTIVSVVARAARRSKHKLTIKEARCELDRIEAEARP